MGDIISYGLYSAYVKQWAVNHLSEAAYESVDLSKLL